MFDIGWLELLVIGIVALIVVGPEDLPTMFRNAGRFMGRMRGMAREFQRSMEDAADQTGLKEATSEFNRMGDLGIKSPGKSARAYADGLLKDDDKTAKNKKAKPRSDAADDAAEAAADQAEAGLAEAGTDASAAATETPTPEARPDDTRPDAEDQAPKPVAPAETKAEG